MKGDSKIRGLVIMWGSYPSVRTDPESQHGPSPTLLYQAATNQMIGAIGFGRKKCDGGTCLLAEIFLIYCSSHRRDQVSGGFPGL